MHCNIYGTRSMQDFYIWEARQNERFGDKAI